MKKILWMVLPALALVACDGTGPELRAGDELTQTVQSAHFDFQYSPGDGVDVEQMEAYYGWLTDRLGLAASARIEYRKYRNLDHMERVTDRRQMGWASEGRIHTIWPWDNHEVTHVVIGEHIGRPPALFSEGIAVAFHYWPGQDEADWPRWNGEHVHTLTRLHRQHRRLPDLDELLRNGDFRDFDDQVTYPMAGSFIVHMIERHGLEAVLEVMRRLDGIDDPDAIRSVVHDVLGMSLRQCWSTWLDAI